MISIRAEQTDDHAAIARVIIDAFAASEFGHHGEADLVDALRRDCDDILSLVAVDDAQIIGQILFSPVEIRRTDDVIAGMGLAPMTVAPNRQRSGIGTLLIQEGLRQLSQRDCPIVVVLGHPDYYPKFGFVPSAQLGISHGFAGIEQEVFFAKVLDDAAFVIKPYATAIFRSEFGEQRIH